MAKTSEFVESKPIYTSKTQISNVVSLASVITAIIGAKTKLPPEVVDQVITPLYVAATGIVSSFLSRLTASTKLRIF